MPVRVFRHNLESRVCAAIAQHDAFVGEVAWISSPPVLAAMRGKCLGFVTQNRPFSARLRARYARILSPILPQTVRGVVGKCVGLGEIRTNGTYHDWSGGFQRGSAPFFMHRKVLVFGSMHAESKYFAGGTEREHWVFTPTAVWTGSYNMTTAARRHHEHAVYVESEELAQEEVAEFWDAYNAAAPLPGPSDG